MPGLGISSGPMLNYCNLRKKRDVQRKQNKLIKSLQRMSLPQSWLVWPVVGVAAVISISTFAAASKPTTNAPPYNRNGATQSPLGTTQTSTPLDTTAMPSNVTGVDGSSTKRRLPRLADFSSGSTTTTDNPATTSSSLANFSSSDSTTTPNGSNNTFGSRARLVATLPNSSYSSPGSDYTSGGSNSNFSTGYAWAFTLPNRSYTSVATVHLVVSPVPAARVHLVVSVPQHEYT